MLLPKNVLRKVKKENYEKYGCNVIKEVYLKPKDLEKGKWQPKEINVLL